VRLLALRQPMADDLRSIIVALKVASDLERMGDYAKNIAKRTLPLSGALIVEPARNIPRVSRMVEVMLHDVLDAYVQGGAEQARRVRERDEEVDSLYTSLFRELLTYMIEDSRTITACAHLLFVAKNIERFGDHVTNNAESVHFLVTGRRLTETRSKGDTTSSAVLGADG
jgi:phosphate transport system protein